ncbi:MULTISPECIES: menaquinone biosynthesis decarboxylase [unclassified Nitratiruptor]|uniref:menaquinone biosynthesis decarboxylase n=1 Tax=unclassified Nitratiruptor TaxID=2624044 RepID=UPI001914F266|nr:MULTISPECIES: menaquinone biosynthesis decarboxylase [unclassified Nitratiruptor]BCD60434.1 4-hydroxy-3-polyprenylbenzoate decarboxylase [Nitratiruptor sp. YY08-10]BCD64077.1 4-hydroxy-3-polyprenylbenzoate decarboxylase [Nitratiruptor sp. YY08-14]
MDVIEFLKRKGDLKIIDEELDVNLEIPHIAYIEVKKEDSRPILFTNPVDRKLDKKYDFPVLMNIFANFELTTKILGKHPDEIAKEIEELLHLKPPSTWKEKLDLLSTLFRMKNVFPKRLDQKGECQEIEIDSLHELPILKTWPEDGGKFITTGQVYTKDLHSNVQNVGMYRLQVYDDMRLGMHWQIHKDGAHFFHEYKKARKKMPVTVAIGGDPLYIWCGQAPMPPKVFELLLYGFIRNQNPELVKSLTNDIWIPKDVDFVIEGYVDPNNFEIEGPFGDHTGYYTLPEPFPVMEVTKITAKKNPVFTATVVGKPPLEDKYMGWGTERIFLPLLKTTASDLMDYHMPENGVFHNLILAKMDVRYPAHAKQFMHAFWGVGQMSFVKHAIFMDKDAPDLTDYEAVTCYICNHLAPKNILISEGVVDHLDHSSPRQFEGGKLGIDATGEEVKEGVEELLSDKELLEKLQSIDGNFLDVKQYMTNTKNPLAIAVYKKEKSLQTLFEKLGALQQHCKVLIVVNDCDDLDNPYMLVWRVVNNIDAQRDVVLEPFIIVDGTNKDPKIDTFDREWPPDVVCDKEVIKSLRERGILDIDEEFIKKYGIV